MCRIAGGVSRTENTGRLRQFVSAMCTGMAHGGPDDSGIFEDVEASLVFGHRRLSIIDLSSKGHQPMADPLKRVWITFNGEIYNYRELGAELHKLGVRFLSDTDTEVLLQAYLHWGTASFTRFRGMFAFALYDVARQETYLVRDTSGIKPLYYTSFEGNLFFASETRAFKMAGVAGQSDSRWPVWLLAFGHIPEPYTTLQNVRSLPKGHYLCRKNDGAFTVQKFSAEKTFAGYIQNAGTLEEGIREMLSTAVKRQMIADAPIGVFLSGGVDSSVLTLLGDEFKHRELKTISIYFDESAYDERRYQRAVLERIQGENFSHLVTPGDFEIQLPAILRAMDLPTTDGINSWFISKYAHDSGLKAVLSGVGADELFGGYPSFKRINLLPYLRKLPSSVLAKAELLGLQGHKRLAYLAYDNPAADYLFLRGLHSPGEIIQILDMDEHELKDILFSFSFPELGAYTPLHASWFETNMYMQNQLLRDTDVMSMCHGLEVRVPFLDEDFQEYTRQIAPDLRFNLKHPKKLLIDSFRNILPEEVWNRPKMGFTFPLQDWMRSNTVIADENHYEGRFARKMIAKFKAGASHWSRAFALYQVQHHG